jgi:hypothetical protein
LARRGAPRYGFHSYCNGCGGADKLIHRCRRITLLLGRFAAAATLVANYFMPMAERVFGDAAATDAERHMATLARWIIKEKVPGLHVRLMQREVRLPGLRTAEQIKKAADGLVEADWLRPLAKAAFGQPRARGVYLINPKLYEA